MKHSGEAVERAAERYERLTEALDPESTQSEDLSDLRAVADAADAVHQEAARLRQAVEVARAHPETSKPG